MKFGQAQLENVSTMQKFYIYSIVPLTAEDTLAFWTAAYESDSLLTYQKLLL